MRERLDCPSKAATEDFHREIYQIVKFSFMFGLSSCHFYWRKMVNTQLWDSSCLCIGFVYLPPAFDSPFVLFAKSKKHLCVIEAQVTFASDESFASEGGN